MAYYVQYSRGALRQLKKMDRFVSARIVQWIGANLDGCSDPRVRGKSLSGNRSGEWRWRVGDYRVLGVIEDDMLVIHVIAAGHRREIYER